MARVRAIVQGTKLHQSQRFSTCWRNGGHDVPWVMAKIFRFPPRRASAICGILSIHFRPFDLTQATLSFPAIVEIHIHSLLRQRGRQKAVWKISVISLKTTRRCCTTSSAESSAWKAQAGSDSRCFMKPFDVCRSQLVATAVTLCECYNVLVVMTTIRNWYVRGAIQRNRKKPCGIFLTKVGLCHKRHASRHDYTPWVLTSHGLTILRMLSF